MNGRRRHPRSFLAAILVGLASLAPAVGQDSPFAAERPADDRISALEDAIRQLQQGGQPPPGTLPTPKPSDLGTGSAKPSVLAGWDDKNGFHLRSADDRFI